MRFTKTVECFGCLDIDECSQGACGAAQTSCSNTDAFPYTCECEPGYHFTGPHFGASCHGSHPSISVSLAVSCLALLPFYHSKCGRMKSFPSVILPFLTIFALLINSWSKVLELGKKTNQLPQRTSYKILEAVLEISCSLLQDVLVRFFLTKS